MMTTIMQFEWNVGYAHLYYNLMLPDEVQEKLTFCFKVNIILM